MSVFRSLLRLVFIGTFIFATVPAWAQLSDSPLSDFEKQKNRPESDLEPQLGIDKPIGQDPASMAPIGNIESDQQKTGKSGEDLGADEVVGGMKPEKLEKGETAEKSAPFEKLNPADLRLLKQKKKIEAKIKSSRRSKKDRFQDLKEGVKEDAEDVQLTDDEPEDVDYFDPEIASTLGFEKSPIEEIFYGKFPGEISRELKQFGYDLFRRKPSTFTPLEDIPIRPDYVVGPGDVFVLNVWGASNFSKTLTVRRDGTVFIPKVGIIKVLGLTYKQMTAAIEKRLSTLLSGVRANITFESIRSIDVYVIGDVKRPGTYSIPSTATPLNALFYAGGPKKNGSLRNIKLIRDNKQIGVFDFYDFLVSGVAINQSLQSQDVLFVPVIGRVAAVAGNVKRPAIYELKDGTRLFDLLRMSGGLTFAGHIGRLSLERVKNNKERVTKDFQIPENFNQLTDKEAAKTELAALVEDGDFVQVFPVLEQVTKTVYLRGHAKRPGFYEFKEGMRIKDIIPSFEVLKAQPYTDFVQISRKVGPKNERISLFVSLEKLIEGDASANIELHDSDQIITFSKSELHLKEKVSISGRVNKPGTYYYFPGMRLKDLIYMAGNLSQDAYLGNAEIARYVVGVEELQYERFQVNLKSLFSGVEADNPLLEARDNVLIQGIPNWQLENYIMLSGQVKFPGKYSYSPKERLSSVLERAGGFTERAFLPGGIFNRVSVKKMQEKNLKEQMGRLEEAVLQESIKPSHAIGAQDMATFQEAVSARKALLKNLAKAEVSGRMIIRFEDLKDFKGSRYDITMEPNDALIIPQMPSTVNVMGEVYNQTSLVFVPEKTVQYYLDKTGGTTINADNESIFIIRADGSVISRRQNRGFLLRNFYQTQIELGDTILVPKDITQFSWLNATKDITEILFKIASTTGITITALK